MRLRVKNKELRRLRLEAGLDQEALGELAGLSSSAISRLEVSARTTRPVTVKRIADALGCSVLAIAEVSETNELAS